MLANEYNFSSNKVTVTQVVANLGAILGGTTVGYSSQIFGRRFCIVVMCILGGALLYPDTYVSNCGSIFRAVLCPRGVGCYSVSNLTWFEKAENILAYTYLGFISWSSHHHLSGPSWLEHPISSETSSPLLLPPLRPQLESGSPCLPRLAAAKRPRDTNMGK